MISRDLRLLHVASSPGHSQFFNVTRFSAHYIEKLGVAWDEAILHVHTVVYFWVNPQKYFHTFLDSTKDIRNDNKHTARGICHINNSS